MILRLICPTGHVLDVDSQLAGRKIRCGACGKIMLVPQPPGANRTAPGKTATTKPARKLPRTAVAKPPAGEPPKPPVTPPPSIELPVAPLAGDRARTGASAASPTVN